MQFFGAPQRIAKKRSIGVSPMYPLCALAELSQGSGGNIVHIKLCRGEYTPRLSVAKLNFNCISPIEYHFLFVELFPMDLNYSDLSKDRSSRDFGRGIYLAF